MASQHGTEWFAEVAARWDDMPMAVANNVNILKSITRHLGYDFDWSSASVLEVGSGTGLLSLEMAPRVKHVLAIDPSEAMMAQLIAKKEKRAINNLTTITAALDDIAQLEGRIFDIVVVAMTLHHIEHLNPILTIFAQSLAPKGRLFVYDFLREAGSDQFHGSDDTFDHEAAGVHHRAGFNEEDLAGLFGQAGLELEYAKSEFEMEMPSQHMGHEHGHGHGHAAQETEHKRHSHGHSHGEPGKMAPIICAVARISKQ